MGWCVFGRKEEVFKRREEGLKKKDLDLQESLIRFSKFLQENDSKRTRAEKKAADEIKLRLQKEAEIETLNTSVATLQVERVSERAPPLAFRTGKEESSARCAHAVVSPGGSSAMVWRRRLTKSATCRDELDQKTSSELVEKNMSYQKYLETVLDTGDEYHEIGNLLDRFTTLDATNREMRSLMRERELGQEATFKELQVRVVSG